MSLYYQPSNKMPIGGVLLFLLGGGLAAAVLAFIYVYAIWYIPILYVNVFICAGFAMFLAFSLLALAIRGKLRSPNGVTVLAVLVGLAAVYLEWSVYLTLVFNSETTGTGANADTSTSFNVSMWLDALAHPSIMWEAMSKINSVGTWSLKGSTPSGLWLWAVWLAELVLIVGVASMMPRMQASTPFSELANEWTEEEILPHPIAYVSNADRIRRALETGQFQALVPHIPQSAVEPFARLKVHRASHDTSCQYLTLENVSTEIDSKGKADHRADPVVEYLIISAAAYDDLKQRFGQPPAMAGL